MIELIDHMIRMAKQVTLFGGRVYRSYPQLSERMPPFAVVNPAGRSVLRIDDNNEETLVTLTYRITIFANSPEDCDSVHEKLTSIYNAKNIQCSEYSPSFQTSNGMFTASCTFTGNVDEFGFVFR